MNAREKHFVVLCFQFWGVSRVRGEGARVSKTPPPRNEPRMLGARAWYYLNPASIDLVCEERVNGMRVTTQLRIRRRQLQHMLKELTPASAGKADV